MKGSLFLLIATIFVPVFSRAQPGGGGATYIPTFSYHHPSTFFLRCDMTGAYLTHDGGQHYRQINFPGGAQSFAFDPADDKVIYVGSEALYRSGDDGNTWQQIYPRPEQVIARTYSGDHAEISLKVNPASPYWLPGQTIKAIRVDPADNHRIYFSVGSSLYYSPDGGGSWSRRDFAGPLEYLYASPAGDLTLFSADSLFVLDHEAHVIARREYPVALRSVMHFAAGVIKHTTRSVFYALDRNTIWTSVDEGRHWMSASGDSHGIPAGASMAALGCAEYDAGHAYAVVDKVGSSKVYYGVFRTSDAGGHWNWVWKAGGGSGQYGVPDAHNPTNLSDRWVGKAFGNEFVQLLDIGVAPYDGSIAVVTDWYRVMKTIDGGLSWTGVYSRSLPGGAAASTGLDVTTTYGVHFDPWDRKHIAVSCTDIGYHHSFDGGKSWKRSVTGVPRPWVNTCYCVAFDPTIRNKCWSAWSGIHDLPRGKMTRDPQWKAKCRGGVCVSVDGGRHWKPCVEGMGFDAPSTSIIIDPHSPTENRILYATVYNKGLFKSMDGGRTWALHNKGIGDNTCAFEVTLAANGDLYLVVSPTPDFHDPSRFYSGALYKSTDGAESWQLLHPAVADTLFPSGIGVDASHPKRIFLACWSDITLGDLYGSAVRKGGGDRRIPMPGGVFRSEDGGHSWVSVFDEKQYVYDVTVDGHHPGRVYINTFTGAAYRSDDYGNTWKAIRGYDFHWGHRVLVDENDPEQVYLTTYGSGIRHILPRTAPWTFISAASPFLFLQ